MSIKSQLTKLIIATVILAGFFAALHGYQNSLKQLDTIFDRELVSVANLLSEVIKKEDALPASVDSDIAFQVIQHNTLIARSANAPSSLIKLYSKGFSETTFFGQRWRAYSLTNPNFNVIVAQPIAARSESAESILLVTILPIIIAVPVIAFLIFYIVKISLSDLISLSRQLKHKSSDDLSKIHLDNPPEELQPVLYRVNNLFERLSSAFEREKQLTANAAHELRTPISVLRLTAHNIAQEHNNGSLTNELIDELNNNINRQAHVIEQMIALYRFAPEQFKLEVTNVDLHEILQDVITQNFDQLDANQQTIELEGAKCRIQGEYFALFTLFENIIRNSIKYSGQATRILITIGSDTVNNIVTIEDSGIGISELEIDKIFTRFYRVKEHTTRVKGSGLGLSIAQHVVDLHKGTIRCSRSLLGGLKTEIVLPYNGSKLDE